MRQVLLFIPISLMINRGTDILAVSPMASIMVTELIRLTRVILGNSLYIYLFLQLLKFKFFFPVLWRCN